MTIARLSERRKRSYPKSVYALGNRRFPIPDKKRARAAKSYAAKMYKQGKLSKSQKQKVDAKANAKLRQGSSGSKRKRSRKRRGRSRR